MDIAVLFRQISFDESIDFQAQMFGPLMEAGCFVKTDPYILALEFFSPIFPIFYRYDNDPEDLEKAKELSYGISSISIDYTARRH